MNTLKRCILALTLAVSCASLPLLAEPTAHENAGGETHGKAEKAPRVSRVDRLAAELGLTDEQKTQIAAIYKEENAALKTISDDKSLERAGKIARNKEIREAHVVKIRALLSPDQQAKFDALSKERAAGEKAGAHK